MKKKYYVLLKQATINRHAGDTLSLLKVVKFIAPHPLQPSISLFNNYAANYLK